MFSGEAILLVCVKNLEVKSHTHTCGILLVKETYRCCALHVFDFQVPSLFNRIFYIFKHPLFSQHNQFINLVLTEAWKFDKIS